MSTHEQLNPMQQAEVQRNPEALANPEDIARVHEALTAIIDGVPADFIWDGVPSRGLGDRGRSVRNIRFLSQPVTRDEVTGIGFGESFTWISFFENEDGQHIMVTEDQQSGNPWGDVIGSLEAGAIVRRTHRKDTAFTSPTEAAVRTSHFTFGPAGLEEQQNAEQINNTFKAVKNAEIDRLGEILVNAVAYAHDAKCQLPRDWQNHTLPLADLLLNRQ